MVSISEIFYQCRADSIKNLIPATVVKTNEDIETYNKNGFSIGFTADEFQSEFPLIPIDKVFYNNGFAKIYYYDAPKFILFELQIYGRETLSLTGDFQGEVLKKISFYENSSNNKKYIDLLLGLNDVMKFEIFTEIILSGEPFEDAYEIFISLYTTAEYGFNNFTKEFIEKISTLKTDGEKKETAKKLSSYRKEILVYRGEGEKSQEYTKAYSWTTDINIAHFFATRMGSKKARIISAKVKKEDVFECGRKDEKELLISPDKVYDINVTNLYGLDDLETVFASVGYNYKKYRNVIDTVGYSKGVHGTFHVYRVLLHALILSYYLNLEDDDLDILATACAWHDIGRTHDWVDYLHGLHSAEKYKQSTRKYNSDVYFLIQYHCIDDEKALEELEEIYKSSTERKRMRLLFNLIKDADALDRIRLGQRDTDVNYLRLNKSKRMTLVARLLYENIK